MFFRRRTATSRNSRRQIKPRTRLWLSALENREVPASFIVTSAGDDTTGAGGSGNSGDLRYCITQANLSAGADDITFAVGINPNITAAINITEADSLTISGNGIGATTISFTGTAGVGTRIFNVNSVGATSLTLANLTLSGGKNTGSATATLGQFSGGAILLDDDVLVANSVSFTGNSALTGGAIAVTGNNAQVTINNSSFTNNTATVAVNNALYGGGAISMNASTVALSNTLTINNSTFTNNTSTGRGGAILAGGSTTTLTTVTITDTVFTTNTATSGGGAIMLNTGIMSVSGASSFTANRVSGSFVNGGAILLANGSNVSLTNASFANNFSPASGGAVSSGSTTTFTVTDSSFTGNTANSGAGGAFLIGGTSTVTLTNSTVAGNRAVGTSGTGGGVDVSSGVVNIDRSGIVNNSAGGNGGGLRLNSASFTITNTTISGNTAAGTSGGGAIYHSSGNAAISFSTIVNNVATNATSAGGGIRKTSATGTVDILGSVIAQNSSVTGGADYHNGTTVTLNITGDGNFFGVANVGGFNLVGTGNITGTAGAPANPILTALTGSAPFYHLPGPGSPLRDNGPVGSPGVDQINVTRPIGPAADIGAIESSSSTPAGRFVVLPQITTVGSGNDTVQIVYTDTDGNFDTTTLNANNIEIKDSNGTPLTITGAAVAGSLGNSTTVTYTFAIPGNAAAGWDGTDNGNYSVAIKSGTSAKDATSNAVPAGVLGFFNVGVVDTITVTTANDVVAADGLVSLREAINFANNATSGVSTINFSLGSPSTITLAAPGEMAILTPVTITGPGAASLTINANKLGRVFQLTVPGQGAVTTISGLTLTGGSTTGNGGAILANDDSLTLNNVTLTGNSAASGGAIASGVSSQPGPVITINDSTITNNTSTGAGGGIALTTGGTNALPNTVIVNKSVIAGNSAATSGGGIVLATFSGGLVNVTDSQMTNNRAFSNASNGGGAIANTGSATVNFVNIVNSTLAANTAHSVGQPSFGNGGAVYVSGGGNLSIYNSTIAKNVAGVGGGVFLGNSTAQLNTISSSIIAQNTSNTASAQPDVHSALTSGMATVLADHNLIGLNTSTNFTFSGVGNQIGAVAPGINPLLTNLSNYGGPTLIYGLLPGSPALNAGSNFLPVATDQRGVARPGDPTQTDIGAFEGTVVRPMQNATLPNVPPNGSVYVATVVYTDETGINTGAGSINTNNVRLSGPSYTNQAPISATVKSGMMGDKSVTVEYTFNTPTVGGWLVADNGTYTLTALGNVLDTDGSPNTTLAESLGSFFVGVPTVFVVDTADDVVNAGDGKTSLREAIALTNATSPGVADIITFAASLGSATLTMASTEFTITDPVIIDGTLNGATAVTISGNDTTRIFNFNIPGFGTASTLANLTLTKGRAASGNGAAVLANDDALIISGTTISNSTATSGYGGGVAITGNILTISSSRIVNSSAGGLAGGGIRVSGTSTLFMDGSTVEGNIANTAGGISLSGSPGFITNSTISGNTSTNTASGGSGGGGILTNQYLFIANSTIANNLQSGNAVTSNARGGGILTTNSLTIRNSTIANNTANATGGGGGISFSLSAGQSLVLDSTIVGSNVTVGGTPSSADLIHQGGSTITVAGNNNLIGVAPAGTTLFTNAPIFADPMLTPLANYGGTTKTMGLKAGSPALEAGSNITPTITFDQRGAGFPRTVGAKTDIGSFEGVAPVPSATATLPNVPPTNATYEATIVYDGLTPIDISSIDTTDVTLSGPGYGMTPVSPTGVVVTPLMGNQVQAVYTFAIPGGSWDQFDSGSYNLNLVGVVRDTNLVPVSTGTLGSFQVSIAGTYVVDNLGDVVNGNYGPGDLTLREAIALANASEGATDTITFAPSLFTSGPQTLLLTAHARMTISDSVVINGPGASVLTVDGDSTQSMMGLWSGFGIFNITNLSSVVDVTINKLTVTKGAAGFQAQGAITVGENEILTVNDSVFTFHVNQVGTGNPITGGGGAIFARAGSTLNINRSTFSDNSEFFGGAIAARGNANITDSTFKNNTAVDGGAVWGGGNFNIVRSTFTGNSNGGTVGGGALYFYGTAKVTNSTISGNSSNGAGGGVLFVNTATGSIESSTIVNNTANQIGGGLYVGKVSNYFGTQLPVVNVYNTIIAKNINNNLSFPSSDVFQLTGSTINNDYNLFGVGDLGWNGNVPGPNSQFGFFGAELDPLVGPLANNGGYTQTHALLTGSLAINNGSDTITMVPATDQRGNNRKSGTNVDIGAYEVSAPAKVTSLVINNGDAQRSNVFTVQLTFSNHTGFSPTAFKLARVSDGKLVDLATTIDNSGSGTKVTFTFTGGAVDGNPANYSLQNGRYVLSIDPTQVTGDGLDGNGDGIAGDAYNSPTSPYIPGMPSTAPTGIFRLFGDGNGDGIVDSSDFLGFRLAFLGSSPVYDFDGNGTVDSDDFLQFRLQFLKTVV